jgi:isopentenyl diphosphate isomerase/L-lactate dehydrogenase-like FMN-dependent dehydrogenase
MVFCGRAFVYGAAAGGLTGVEKAFAILSQELRDTLTQIGCNSLADLAQHIVPDMRADVVSHSSASTER